MRNKENDKKLVRRTFSVEPETYMAFERLARENDLSAAWLIRKAMEEFLDRVDAGEGVALQGVSGAGWRGR